MKTSEKLRVKNKKYANAKGITLITLIFTVIILIILIAVVVDIAVDGKLVDSAKEAVTATNDKVAQHQNRIDDLMGTLEDAQKYQQQQQCSHTGVWETITEATCVAEGKLERTCEICEYKETKKVVALGHTYSNGTCQRCNQTCTHSNVTWITTTQTTCTTNGAETGTCQICGYVQTRTILALGHNYSESVCQKCGQSCPHATVTWVATTQATCTTQGSETGTCQTCGNVQTRTIAALGHSIVNGICSRCGASVPINASAIANSSTKSNFYGKYVTGITLNNGDTETEWRIFYADSSNIYLIAADYIDAQAYVSSDLVDNIDNYTGSAPSTKYKAYFSKTITLEAYNGGAEETAIFGEGTVGGTLLKTYLDYLDTNNLTKNNDNMKATAFMLDTTAWSGYTDSDQTKPYIDYAIGGPTIEMLRDSYNGYKGTTSMYTPVNTYGYYFGNSPTTTLNTTSIGTTNSLYVNDTTTTNADGYWLASPSARNNYYVCIVYYNGSVNLSYYNGNYYGFRPLVRLSSNVKLTPSGTDTYTVGY